MNSVNPNPEATATDPGKYIENITRQKSYQSVPNETSPDQTVPDHRKYANLVSHSKAQTKMI